MQNQNNKRRASQAQLADPSRKPGRKNRQRASEPLVSKKAKKGKTKSRPQYGNATRGGGKQDKIS
jgi:hypothetical protein